jgi:hypothetical protein
VDLDARPKGLCDQGEDSLLLKEILSELPSIRELDYWGAADNVNFLSHISG